MQTYTRRDLLKTGLAASAGSMMAAAPLDCSVLADVPEASSSNSSSAGEAGKPYRAAWESLKRCVTPPWLQEGKFGIYTHWGVYAVAAQGGAFRGDAQGKTVRARLRLEDRPQGPVLNSQPRRLQ